MTIRLGSLVVDAVEPRAVESFWAAARGGPAQHALLSFRQQRRAKTVKNRVHLDVYVRDVEALRELGGAPPGLTKPRKYPTNAPNVACAKLVTMICAGGG